MNNYMQVQSPLLNTIEMSEQNNITGRTDESAEEMQISCDPIEICNKEQLIQVIKEWVKNDNELRILQHEIRSRNQEKKKITAKLMNIMRNHEIDCFDINDGKILYKKKNIKQSITKSYLLNILSNYYQGDSNKVNELNTFILAQRKITVKESIVRKISTNDTIP